MFFLFFRHFFLLVFSYYSIAPRIPPFPFGCLEEWMESGWVGQDSPRRLEQLDPNAKPSQEPQHSPRRTQNTQGSQETPQRQPGALQGCQRSPPKASKRASNSKCSQIPRQTLPKPSQNRAKIDPEGFLEPILDQCFKKAGF